MVFRYSDDEAADKELIECVRFGGSDGNEESPGQVEAKRINCQTGKDLS